MKHTFHELLLSELHMVVYQPGNTELTDRLLCEAVTLNENLRSLGFTLRPGDLAQLATGPDLYHFYENVHALVPQVNAKPMYPGFPQQVLKMDEATFRFHQAMHYFSTYGIEQIFGAEVSRGWLPEDNTPERTRDAAPILDAKVIELVAESDAPKTVLRILLSRRERLTDPELQLITEAAELCDIADMSGLTVRFKENLELLFPRMLMSEGGEKATEILRSLCVHTGDVLRCAHAFLKANGYHLKTAQKKRIVHLLEKYPVSNLKSNLIQSNSLRERNLLVLQHLDFNRFAKNAEHREAVRALRNGELLSWNGIAEQMLARNDPKVLHFLAGRPGTMLRMINRLLSLGYSAETILAELRPQAAKFSGQMLMRTIRSLSGREGRLEALHEKELRDVRQRHYSESKHHPSARILREYTYETTRIHANAEARRRNAWMKYITNPERGVQMTAFKKVQAVEADIQRKKAELEALWKQLEKLNEMEKKHARGAFCSLVRNTAGDFEVDPSVLLYRPESIRVQWDLIRKELEALESRLTEVRQEAQAYLEAALKDIDENGQAYLDIALREIDDEERCMLNEAETRRDAALAPYAESKGSLEERHAEELAKLEEMHRSRVRISKYDAEAVSVLKELCAEHFRLAETPLKGKKVFYKLDEFDLNHSELETTDRSKDGGYIRSGIAFKIPDGAKTVRFFVYWNDQRRVDVDLHAAGTTLDGRELHIGWDASCKDCDVVYSGDMTHSDAAEYIDIDMSAPVRTITANVSLFCGKPSFKYVETCFAGLMAVNEKGQDVKLYSPANCFFTHNLTQKTNNLFYGYIDVQNRFVRFIGQNNSTGWAGQYNTDISFSLAEYLDLVMESQGARTVCSEAEADVVLTMGKGMAENSVSLVDENFFLEC